MTRQPFGAAQRFPIGNRATLGELDQDPHSLLARLRPVEPVSWLPVLDGWLVSRYDIAAQVLRNPKWFTVDDPRFSTARVVGPSMLSLDGSEHARHRRPFASPLHPAGVRGRFAASIEAHVERLITAIEPAGAVELRREFAGPLAVAVVAEAFGLPDVAPKTVLSWYHDIVSAVSKASAQQPVASAGAEAFARLRTAVLHTVDDPDRSSLLAEAAPTAPAD